MQMNNEALSKYSALFIFVCYVLILCGIAFFTRYITSDPDAWTVTLDSLVKKGIGLNDPTSFGIAAKDIYETGWLRVENYWIFKLWPPGFPLIQSALLRIFGENIPIIAALQLCAVLLHATVAFCFYKTLRKYTNGAIAVFLGIFPYLFPLSGVFLLHPTGVFLLHPTGVALGETFAVGFFMLGTLASIQAVSTGKYTCAVIAGVFLALSAYIRSQFEIILMIQAVVAATLLFFAAINILRRLDGKTVSAGKLLCLIIIIASTQATMLPWRLYHFIQEGTFRWGFTSDITARNAVMPDSEMIAAGGEFVVLGGGTVVCQLAPQTCGNYDQAKSLFYKTFFEHPIDWLSYKASLAPAYWFAPLGDWGGIVHHPSIADLAYNSIFAIFIIVAVTLAFISRRLRHHDTWLPIILFNTTLLVAHGAISVFAHFEVRYFYFPKLIGMMLFLLEVAIVTSTWSTRHRQSFVQD